MIHSLKKATQTTTALIIIDARLPTKKYQAHSSLKTLIQPHWNIKQTHFGCLEYYSNVIWHWLKKNINTKWRETQWFCRFFFGWSINIIFSFSCLIMISATLSRAFRLRAKQKKNKMNDWNTFFVFHSYYSLLVIVYMRIYNNNNFEIELNSDFYLLIHFWFFFCRTLFCSQINLIT